MGKVVGRRLLVAVRPDAERLLRQAAKLEELPLSTFIRRAALLAAKARLAQEPAPRRASKSQGV